MTLRVMIVEDELLISMYLEDILEDGGHTVVGIARDITEALALVLKSEVDVALMDVALARGPDGVEIARVLRETHAVPSLMTTGLDTVAIRLSAETWPPFVMVKKPFQPEEILVALAKLEPRA